MNLKRGVLEKAGAMGGGASSKTKEQSKGADRKKNKKGPEKEKKPRGGLGSTAGGEKRDTREGFHS